MAWRSAKSLTTLREQINKLSPHRSKISDGTIGDEAHSSSKSDHNPDKSGIVRALDITHDPDHGISGKALANSLLKSRDPRISYIISDKQIASGAGGPSPWTWRAYKGANPHTRHMHLSVVGGAKGDDAKPWTFVLTVPPEKVDKPTVEPKNSVLAKGTKGPDVERMQQRLIRHGAKITADSTFGPKTETALISFQKKHKLTADGICGPYSWEALEAEPT